MEASRFDIMDAQRFDLSKRNGTGARLSIWTSHHAEPTRTHLTTHIPPISPFFSHTVFEPWTYTERVAAAACESDTEETSLISTLASEPESYHSSIATAPTPPSSIASADEANSKEFLQTDISVNGPFTTTRTIIRPVSRPAILGCLPFTSPFSRPCSPLSRPSTPTLNPTSRPSSPMNLHALSCFASTDNFELDLDLLQQPRPEMDVVVTRERSVHVEELWRGPVQEMFYGHAYAAGSDGIQSRMGCIASVEA